MGLIMKCKKCDREFHYCSSCDYEQHLFESFCSDKCWEQGDKMKKERNDFLNALNLSTKEFAEWCLENWSESYERFYKKWLKT